MRFVARLCRNLLITLLCGVMIAAAGATTWAIRDHGRLLSIQTTSMTPTIRKGDAVIERAVIPEQLRVGDIISYRSASNLNMTITHRVIRVVKVDASHLAFVTKGDNNNAPDQPIVASQIIGRAFAKAPGLGCLLDFEHTWLGLTVTIYLPAIAVASWEITKVYRSYQQPHYRLRLRPSV